MFREFANLVQVLLIGHGVVVLVETFLPELLQGRFAAMLFALFSGLVLFAALLFYPCLGLNRHLPKRIFLPQLFLLFWLAAGSWPLSGFFDRAQATAIVAVGQVFLGLFSLFWIRDRTGSSLLLTRELFSEGGFRFGYLFRFVGGTLLFLPIALLFLGFSAGTGYVDRLTGGFVRLGVDGLYLGERIYQKQDKTVRLVGMIHIADPDYYEDIHETLAQSSGLILSEGVTDHSGLLHHRFSYEVVADALGLAEQPSLAFPGRRIEVETLYRDDFKGGLPGRPDVARADIDLQEFEPLTVDFINAMARYLLSGVGLASGIADFNHWAREHMPPSAGETIMQDLIDKRNRTLLGHLGAALQKYDTVFIPWGALHLPGIEAVVKERGFVLQGVRERRSIDFFRSVEELVPTWVKTVIE